MTDKALQARECFLKELAKRGKPVSYQGRAAWEQRAQDEVLPPEPPEAEDKPRKADEVTDQTQQQTKSQPPTQSKYSGNGVFVMRAPGMPFEEFKNYCVKLFRERGLIKD